MDDRQLWGQGLRSIKKVLAGLPVVKRKLLSELLGEYRQEKEALAAIILTIDSGAICRECAGQCCLNGKYRLNVFDLFACFDADVSLSPDFMQKPLCPYGGTQGCAMEPAFRPADCILFICDALDNQLSDSDKSVLNLRENGLRQSLDKASRLLGIPVTTPLLLWAERNSIPINL